MGILILAEREGEELAASTRDTIASARTMASQLDTWFAPVIFGSGASNLATELTRCGASDGYYAQHEQLDYYDPEARAEAALDLAGRTNAHAIVAPGTKTGNEVMAHIASRAGLGFAANCSRVDTSEAVWRVRAFDMRSAEVIEYGLEDEIKLASFDHPIEVVGSTETTVQTFVPTITERVPRSSESQAGPTAHEPDLTQRALSQPGVSRLEEGAEPTVETVKVRSGLTTAICALAVFMIALELTVISIAFPDIGEEFATANRSTLSWIFTAYNVGVASLLLLAGWVAERFGRKRVFLAGLIVFTAGSALSGLAPTIGAMIAGRGIQSVGGAMLLPSSLALILNSVPENKRNAAIGAWGATGGVAAAIGPTVGAVLIEFAGWRWIFLLNVPVACIALVVGHRILVDTRDPNAQRTVDPVAVPSGALGTGVLLYVIVTAGEVGLFSVRTIVLAVISTVCIGVFWYRSTRHHAPVFPPDLTRRRSYVVGAVGTGVFSIAMSAWLALIPTFLVAVWGYSSLKAGFAIAPGPATMAIVAGPAAKLADKAGLRLVVLAGLGAATAAVGWWLVFVGATPDYLISFLPGTIMFGIGLGAVFPMLTAAAMRDVEPSRFAIGAAGTTTMRQVGAALGVSIAVAIVGSGVPRLEPFRQSWMVAGALIVATAILVAVSYPPASVIDLRHTEDNGDVDDGDTDDGDGEWAVVDRYANGWVQVGAGAGVPATGQAQVPAAQTQT